MKTNNITADTLTADQIRAARDAYPEHITSECSANALGLPIGHTPGGLPIYPPCAWIFNARTSIAILINARGLPKDEDEWEAPQSFAGALAVLACACSVAGPACYACRIARAGR